MQITVEDFIKSQLRLILANGGDSDAIEDEMMQNAMQANNMLLLSLSGEKNVGRSLIQESFTLEEGVNAYVIGTGQALPNFDTVKPIAIPNAFVRDGASQDYPLNINSEEDFSRIQDKGFAIGTPTDIFYDTGLAQQPGIQTGIINIYPTPDQEYLLFIEQQKYLTELVNLADVLTFEPAYYRFLKYNGAMEYYFEYRSHKYSIPPDLKRLARESKDIVTNMNATVNTARTDLPGCKTGRWNAMSDSYS